MKEPEKLPSLEALQGDIQRMHEKVASKSKRKLQGGEAAMQMGLELVSGVLVGVGTGIVLDKWLGTSPIFLLICFVLGTCGGGLTLYRTATAMSEDDEPTDESAKEK